ncbi:MAG: hypothetical protein P8130_13710, partial [Deltaproteobacteria bacterium]
QRKFPLVLVHRNYQSGKSLLVGFENDLLLIDKPLDWPGTESEIRVIYKARNSLWHHFYSTVAFTSSDTLYLSLPSCFFMLQRRTLYRVKTPPGSLASFLHKRNLYADIMVKDLSACGMLLASPLQQLPLEKGDVLEKIMLTMPLEDEPCPSTILCQGGKVARSAVDPQNRRRHLFGIKFRATDKEEEAISRYVRQRELELLRKVADGSGRS